MAEREIACQSVFKRIAKHGWVFVKTPAKPSPQLVDRAGLGTAWKYVYLFRAANRLTRYVE
jgi:hypothetical protein